MHIVLFKMNVKSFYKKSIQRHTLLKDAVDFVASEVEGPVDVVIVGPPTAGEVNDVELNEDEDLAENNTLPTEVAVERDVFFEEEKEAEVQPPKKKSKKDEANLEWKSLALLHFRTHPPPPTPLLLLMTHHECAIAPTFVPPVR